MNMNKRIEAIVEALEREKLKQDDELDDLSLSLYELEDQLCALTDADIEAMAAEVDEDGKQIWTLEQVHAFVDEWRQRRAERSPRAQRWIDRALSAKKGN